MNNALETGTNNPSVAIGIQPGVLVVAPHLTTKGIDHGTAEDAARPEGHSTRSPVGQHFGLPADNVHKGTTVWGHVVTSNIAETFNPFGTDEIVRRKYHVPISFSSQFKSRIELRTNGKVRHLNITNTILVKEVDIELIPRSDGGENFPDAP